MRIRIEWDQAATNVFGGTWLMAPKRTCFKDAYDLLSRLADSPSNIDRLRLVHGHVINVPSDGSSIAHAWVEDIDGDFVFDVTIGPGSIPKKSYYEKFSVKHTSKYSIIEALKLNIKSGHTGPWEVWLDE